jgi:hypothetical protein
MEALVRRRLGDRRNRPRYDIVGELWGTLETVVRMPLRNVGRGGVLMESHVPLTPNSVHRLNFAWNGEELPTQVCVRHVRPALTAEGEQCFLIGLEFMSVQPILTDRISQWLALSNATAIQEL